MYDKKLQDYAETAGEAEISHIKKLGDRLKGSKVVHVNSTRLGGGVAEILSWLIPLMRDLGIDTSWEIVEGREDFFHVTKSFHNGLQGKTVVLTDRMIETYERTVDENFEKMKEKLEEADFVFIHDPQPAYFHQLCEKKKGKWVWRAHIDVSHPDLKVWNYIKRKISRYDASVFSMPDFAHALPHPQFIIAPSIDPLNDTNCELNPNEIIKTLDRLNIPTDLPILTQVSRFDRFKDPIGVIRAFKLLKKNIPSRLVLAGGGAADDPEGQAVFEEVMESAKDDSLIHVLLLPSDAHRSINALQRASTIVIQKSIQEGFGLTVTEALWKNKPVIGGNAGGIRLQVHNHYTGFLVDTPEGCALRLRYLLSRPQKVEKIGDIAHEFVRNNFLLIRQLREYLALMIGLQEGLVDHVLTG